MKSRLVVDRLLGLEVLKPKRIAENDLVMVENNQELPTMPCFFNEAS
jgi:hypothetical protein